MDFVVKKLSRLSTAARPARVARAAGKCLEPRALHFALYILHCTLASPTIQQKIMPQQRQSTGNPRKRDWESTKLFVSPACTLQISTPETPPDPLGSDIVTMIRIQHHEGQSL